MKKSSKILILLFVLACGYVLGCWISQSNDPVPADAAEPRLVTSVSGKSMLPTLKSGDVIYLRPGIPEVGDIVVYECRVEKCIAGEGHTLVKRVSEVNNDCYTFLGDNPTSSFDSRNYGALCGAELKIEGIVDSVEFSK